MDWIYKFFLNVASTIKDGANFAFATAVTKLKRPRDENSFLHSYSNPLGEGQPILPAQQCLPAPQNFSNEERPSKRRRLAMETGSSAYAGPLCWSKCGSSLTTPTQSTSSPAFTVPMTSAFPSPKQGVRRLSVGISKRLVASNPYKQRITAYHLPNNNFEKTHLSSHQTLKRNSTRVTGKSLHLRRSIVLSERFKNSSVTFGKELSTVSETPVPVHSFLSATTTIQKRIERSAIGSGSSPCLPSNIPQTIVLLPGETNQNCLLDRRRRERSQKTALRQKTSSPYETGTSIVLYPQTQRFVPASRRWNLQPQPLDSSDSE